MIAGGLKARLAEVLGKTPTRVQYIGGGSINQAARVEAAGISYFVKWKHSAPPQFFEREARGLSLLQQSGVIRVPAVIAHSDSAPQHPAYLVLEWIEESPRAEPLAFAVAFGRALADLHRCDAPHIGLDHDNFIGELPQSNKQKHDWVSFYRDQRLLPQIEMAKARRRLNPTREGLLRKVVERLDTLLEGCADTPSLLHGDLWSGNFMVGAGNQPVILDPAVYYGDREVEIAMTDLFGGFPPRFLAAYQEAFPLFPGHERRKALYQLYPLLVHLNLFGEGYGARVDEVCRKYV